MTKLIWMTDPHLVADGLVLGHDPRARLSAAIEHVNAHHADAALCVVSGDMVNRGSAADYTAVADLLTKLNMPCYPMMGNHDDRALLRTHLPLPDTVMPDFVQYEIATQNVRLLLLDTQKPGADAGAFCAARRDWLRNRLDRDPETPVILFMHHPPMALGLPMQDQDRMEDGEGFLDELSGQGNLRFLCIGHVHRPTTGTIRGIPFATMRSVLYQAPAPRLAWDWTSFQPAQEAPQLGVLHVKDGDVTLHYEEFGG